MRGNFADGVCKMWSSGHTSLSASSLAAIQNDLGALPIKVLPDKKRRPGGQNVLDVLQYVISYD